MEAYSAATRHLVGRLLSAGYTHSEVAKKLGIGKATVTRINRGRVRPRPVISPALSPSHDAGDDLPPGYDPQRIRRCAGCGSKVYLWPCLKCQLAGHLEFPADLQPGKSHAEALPLNDE